MNIALIAHDKKKDLMVEFCIAYIGILKKHNLCATGITGKVVSDSTGLFIERFLVGSLGGIEQISSRISYNEVDVLIFFRYSISFEPSDPSIFSLFRLCDIHNIPFATNLSTAEVLIRSIERGDLDWRYIVNSKNWKNNF